MNTAFYDEIHARYSKPADFIRNAKSRMALHRITQGKLAARTGFQPSDVSRWLSGQVRPSLGSMILLDEAIDRLIQGE